MLGMLGMLGRLLEIRSQSPALLARPTAGRRMATMLRQIAFLASAMLLVALLCLRPDQSHDRASAILPPEKTDIGMYQRIAGRVADGANYYSAVAVEHRLNGYPLKPFFTVRLPALAWLTAWAGPDRVRLLAQTILLLCAGLWMVAAKRPIEGVAAALLICAGGFVAFFHQQLYHELWAGMLICAGAALLDRNLLVSAGLVLLAALFREFALLFVAIAGVLAVAGRKWKDAAVWFGVGVIVGLYYAWHAYQVSLVALPGDMSSEGWSGRIGIGRVVQTLAGISLIRLLGRDIGYFIVVVSAFGWLGYRRPEPFVFVASFSLFVATFARPENYYWSFLLHPLLLGGVAFLPQYLSLVGNAFRALRERYTTFRRSMNRRKVL